MSSIDDKLEEKVEELLPELEWKKWLSYETNFEKERKAKLFQKKSGELTLEELKEICKYKRSNIFAKLLDFYQKGTCSKDEELLISDFMSNHSIEEIMMAKLTYEELEFANQEITRLNKISKQELKERIESKKEEYDTLSMVDSYILHRIISNFNHPRKLSNKEVFKTKSDLQDLSTEKKYIYVAKPAMHK